MGNVSRGRSLCGFILLASLLAPAAAVQAATDRSDETQQAARILADAAVRGGWVVHLGCGDGRLTAALGAADGILVQGLDTEEARVAEARRHVQELGIYGPVSIDQFDGRHLPYAENLVNLIVAEDLGNVAVEEAMRVLAPGGTLYAKQNGRWAKTVKPRPSNVDEWTHFLHDASGNPVARDDVVGPPRRVQWIADPPYMRSHEHVPGIYALVSSGGRIFYIVDEAPTSSIRQPPQWQLVARDAYNGTMLWKQPIAAWFPHIVNWGKTPRELQRKLVAVGDRVYVTLGLHSPVTMVDAATGELLKVYEGSEGTEEIVWQDGTLLLAVRAVTDERTAELATWAELVRRKQSPLDDRDSAEPLVNRLGTVESKGEQSIWAVDAVSGRLLWKKEGPGASGLRACSLSALGDRAFYQCGRDVICVELNTGRELWAAETSAMYLVCDRAVVAADGDTATALSLETGKTLWSKPTLLVDVRDAFVVGDSLWIGGFKPCPEKRSPGWGPYFATELDLATGEMLRHVEPDNPGHHHRCYQNKATSRYILGGRRGTEFIDLATGDVEWNSFARGVCKYGVMPCNGLMYAPPHACGCYIGVKLSGFRALAAAESSGQSSVLRGEGRLDQGPAYGSLAPRPSSLAPSDWPTYRHDAERSGSAGAAVPSKLRRRWAARAGGRLTGPTVAGGKVFLASVDEHAVAAIDADSGRPAWQFTAGARVDSPPTIFAGRAIFGCRDGKVYSLQSSDGALAWRLATGRSDRRIAANGRLESVAPVHGSVLIRDGRACFTAGESSYLDGGLEYFEVDPQSGNVLSKTTIYSPDPETGKQPPQSAPYRMPGARSDLLSADGKNVYLRDAVLGAGGELKPSEVPHLFAMTGFLDASWPHRSYWIFGTECSISTGCSGRAKDLIYGRLMVFDDGTIYGYGRAVVHWSNQLQDGPYRLFAAARGDGAARWEQRVPIEVRAMLLAGKVLFVAGRPAGPSGPLDIRDDGPPRLLAVSTADGSLLAEYPLEAPPVFDGMAAAGGRLYIALEDGRLVCME